MSVSVSVSVSVFVVSPVPSLPGPRLLPARRLLDLARRLLDLACRLLDLSRRVLDIVGLHLLDAAGPAGLKIRWAQEEMGVALGDLSENSLEMGNKENNAFRSNYSRKCSIIKETWDIFRRRYLVSDPKVILEGSGKQELRCGHVRGRQEVKEKDSSSFIPYSSTTVYCPWTPGGQLATKWRQLEAASWLAGTSRGYRYTVVEESGWRSSELL